MEKQIGIGIERERGYYNNKISTQNAAHQTEPNQPTRKKKKQKNNHSQKRRSSSTTAATNKQTNSLYNHPRSTSSCSSSDLSRASPQNTLSSLLEPPHTPHVVRRKRERERERERKQNGQKKKT
jgi:hypothetical protein